MKCVYSWMRGDGGDYVREADGERERTKGRGERA